jgi:predicted enzyme related to lactoylglutathione lyase
MANAIQSDVLGKFVWYDQMSNDLPGSEKFYSQVVGWSLEPNTMNSQKYTLLKTGATIVGGLMPIPEDAAKMGVRPAWMGYIAVDDVKKCADKVKAAGGAIHRPPTEIPNVGTFAVAGDPSGAGFLLFKGDGDEAPTQDPTKPGYVGWHELHGVDAIDAAQSRVKSAGGQVIHGPMQVPGGSWIINGLDPQGAMFALVAPKK